MPLQRPGAATRHAREKGWCWKAKFGHILSDILAFQNSDSSTLRRTSQPQRFTFLATIHMPQTLGLVSVVVLDYDEAIAFYVEKLGFSLVEDTHQPAQDKRWVVVSPPGAQESRILLARATNEHQTSRVGDQTGGRVFLFLYTDDFWRDFNDYKAKGVNFVREPKTEDYGTVAVFQDLHGNQWDLVQTAPAVGAD